MPDNRPGILSIAPYRILPATSGGHLGIVSLHDYLGKICDDHIVGTVDNGDAASCSFTLHRIFPASPKRYIPLYGVGKMTRIGREHGVKSIFCDHPYMALSAMVLARRLGVPWFMRSHNIESERFRTMGKKWWRAMWWFERYAMKRADGVFFITPEDIAWAEKSYGLQAGKSHLIPYGTVLSEKPEGHEAARAELAGSLSLDASKTWLYFLGALDYYPNEQAVSYILDEIMPRLDKSGLQYQVLFAGKGLKPALQQQIQETGGKAIYTGFVPVLDTFLKACDIMLNPVILGGGIKTKAVEALGYNKIVVSAQSGAAGLVPIACGDNLHIVPDHDWDAFTVQVVAAAKQVPSIPAAFYETYYWGNIVKKVLRILTAGRS